MNRLLLCMLALSLGVFVTACNTSDTINGNAIANANLESVPATRPGPDNSEITRTTDANGIVTETRVFRDNPRISRVVVTTNNGTRTARAYSPAGEEREISDVEDALEATGDTLASAAGFVGDKAEDVIDETAEGAKRVGEKTVDTAEKVGDRAAEGAKKVGKKTAEGAKKAGKTVKDAVTP